MRNIAYYILAIFLCTACTKTKEDKKDTVQKSPNIVFIMADDHAYQAISTYNHEIGKLAPTPNIDRIAANGVRFDNSFVTNSICGPSRAVILTGKHSHINGFRQNGERFNGDQPTLPKKMQSLGYQTAMIGKWHLHGAPQGFDYYNILKDQGNYYNPDFIKAGDTTRVKGYATDIITKDAINWLKENQTDTVPFFMMVQHKAPHRNWMPALRHVNTFDSIPLPLPDTYFPENNGQIAMQEQLQNIYRDMYEGHDLKLTKNLGSPELAHNPWKTDFNRMSAEQRATWDAAYQPKNDAFHRKNLHGKDLDLYKGQRYLQEYLATIASIDEGVGEILDYLESKGLDENTIIVYTSDQGFYMGEKGMFDKRFMYEESFRTPLLMQYKGHIKEGSVEKGLVQNLDFAQTFLDYVGRSDLTTDMQGQSIKPLLDGKISSGDFRDAVYYHFYDFPAFHMVKRHYGIRTNRYKLMHFYDDIDAWEFYDLEKDPKELVNNIDNPSYQEIIANLHTKLEALQKTYNITDKEFEKTPKPEVDKAYKSFKKLRGKAME